MCGSNISYIFGNALEVEKYFENSSFDKIFCYFALQYFDSNKGRKLIEKLLSLCRPGGQILLGDIPDYNRRWRYYNNIQKKIKYFLGLIYNKVFEYQEQTQHGGFGLGFWWKSDMLTEICKDLRVTCKILEQKKELPHSLYRFDALIIQKRNKIE